MQHLTDKQPACPARVCETSQRAHLTDKLRLLHQRGSVLAHIVNHAHGGRAPRGGLALAGHQEGVHQGLGVVPPDADQDIVNDHPDRLVGSVDAGNDLQCKRGTSDVTAGMPGKCSSCVALRGSLDDLQSRVTSLARSATRRFW